MSRVVIGIPCYDKVAPEVLNDYMRLAYYLGRRYNEHEFWLGIKTKSEQFRARNAIVEAAYQVNAEYLLMLDDDHVFDPDGVNYASQKYEFLRTLLHHMENDRKLGLVGCLYYHRGGGCKPVLLIKDGKDYRYLQDDEILGGLQEVDIQGGGIMLMRMSALDFVGAPWFEPEIEYGTDFQICRKLKAAGFKVACDTSIEVGHVASERKIITSANRHKIQADSTKIAKDVEVSARLEPIYRQFKQDIMEYLGVNSVTDLQALHLQYGEHKRRFEEYQDKNQYYIEAGKPYLARAAMIARTDSPWPALSDDYLLQVLRTGVPAIGIDFGAGHGRITFEYSKAGHMMHYMDIEGAETFNFLKWRINKYRLVAKFNEWPAPGTADYAISNDVFEHIMDVRTPLSKIYECLKPGGLLITNYLLMADWTNVEHINNDKPGFLQVIKDLGMVTVNSCVYQKVKVD